MELLIVYTEMPPSSLMASAFKELLSKRAPPWQISWKRVEHHVKWYAEAQQILVFSPHKSKTAQPLLSLHVPGNPCEHWVSGEDYTLNISNPLFNYRLFLSTYKHVQSPAIDVPFSYEVDHHGPTIESPVLFYEIGSDEDMWQRRDLAELMAASLYESLTREDKPTGIYLGIGGGHYAPKFTRASVEKGMAFSHILSKYAVDCAPRDVFKQALEKSTLPVDGIAADWKGLNAKQREKIKAISDELNLEIIRL